MGVQIGDRAMAKPLRPGDAALRWAICAGRRAVAGMERKPRTAVERLPRMPLWAVGRVFAGFEFEIADALTAQGFFGWAPHKVRVFAHARVGGSNARRRAVERDYAVLPGYVIVGCPAGRYPARGDLLRGLLGDPVGRPGLSQKAVDELARVLCGVAVGDSVEADVFGARLRGVVSALRKAGVVVDVEMFGGVTPVEVGVDRVSRVGLQRESAS